MSSNEQEARIEAKANHSVEQLMADGASAVIILVSVFNREQNSTGIVVESGGDFYAQMGMMQEVITCRLEQSKQNARNRQKDDDDDAEGTTP